MPEDLFFRLVIGIGHVFGFRLVIWIGHVFGFRLVFEFHGIIEFDCFVEVDLNLFDTLMSDSPQSVYERFFFPNVYNRIPANTQKSEQLKTIF